MQENTLYDLIMHTATATGYFFTAFLFYPASFDFFKAALGKEVAPYASWSNSLTSLPNFIIAVVLIWLALRSSKRVIEILNSLFIYQRGIIILSLLTVISACGAAIFLFPIAHVTYHCVLTESRSNGIIDTLLWSIHTWIIPAQFGLFFATLSLKYFFHMIGKVLSLSFITGSH